MYGNYVHKSEKKSCVFLCSKMGHSHPMTCHFYSVYTLTTVSSQSQLDFLRYNVISTALRTPALFKIEIRAPD